MSAEVVATLTVKHPDGQEQRLVLRDGQEVTAGRETNNDIVIQDPGASRLHASFAATSTGIVLADRSSTNGTFVNGQQLTGMKDLTSKDIIDIGRAKISVKLASEEVVDSMSGGTSARAMTAQMRPISVSVLVASIRSLDVMKEKLSTNDVAEMQLKWMAGVKGIVSEFDGKIDKVIGGTVVVIWAGKDDKNLALRAARSMQKISEFTNELSASWNHNESYPWRSSIVISSGLGLQAAPGVDSRQGDGGFTLMGDPINIAFHLETIIEQVGELVVIDDTTSQLVHESLELRSIGNVPLEGRSEPVELFTLQL